MMVDRVQIEAREVTDRLRRHAGPGDGPDPSVPAVIDFPALDETTSESFRDAVADCIDALAALNDLFNPPARTLGGGVDDPLPRGLVYAVTEIIRILRGRHNSAATAREAEAFSHAVWSVELAWSAVLAGDIRDLPEHIREERASLDL